MSPLSNTIDCGVQRSCLLSYMIKAALHACRHRGGAQIIPCRATPRPITGAISPSKVHLHKPAGEQDGRWQTSRTPCPGPSQGCPGRVSVLLFRHETHHHERLGAALHITFQANKGCCLGMGHIMGCSGNTASNRTGLIMEFSGEERKVGQGMCLADLGRGKSGENSGIRG